MMTVQSLSDLQNVSFGTSGLRGLSRELTPRLCYAYTQAFLREICPDAKAFAVALDLRPSSVKIAKSVIKAAEDLGLNVDFYGFLPTPALAYTAIQEKKPCIMITGSHIPFDRNGLKFYTPFGEISKAEEARILSAELILESVQYESDELPIESIRAKSNYINRYLDVFPPNTLGKKRIGVYEHSSVGRDIITSILMSLGADVVRLDRSDVFVPIDTEAISEKDQEKATCWAKTLHLDAIVSMDGDADRPLVADERGQWIRGDMLGVVLVDFLNATHVATPVNSNTSLEFSKPNISTARTRIGSPYVIDAMNTMLLNSDSNAVVVGYEANGGFIVGSDVFLGDKTLKALPTRDAALPILAVLCQSSILGVSISEMFTNFQRRYTHSDRLININLLEIECFLHELCLEPEKSSHFIANIFGDALVKIDKIEETDGLRMYLTSSDIIHLRVSGNAPELRIYSESSSLSEAQSLVYRAKKYICARKEV